MIRNIKMLGLTVLAVLAVGAVSGSASASAADVYTAESAPYTLTGSQTEKLKFTVTSGLSIECGVANFHATVATTSSSDIVTSVPEFKECTFNKEPLTVTMNGCTFTFNGTTGAEGHLQTKLLCPAGQVVALDAPSISCTMTVAPQTTTKGVKPTNQGTGTTRDVLLDLTAGVTISHDGTSLACQLTGTTATLTGTGTATGETDGGTTHVGTEVSGS